MSQAVWVKSGTSNASGNGSTTAEPMFPYDNFGVWGIARQGSLVYNLWGNDGLTEVVDPEQRIANNITNSTTPRVFTPTVDAYWLRGYTYNFLAIAPLNPSGLTNVSFTLANDAGNTTGKDYMTFTYDMSSKYNGIPATNTTPAVAPDYTFDLLGAAAEQAVTTGGYSTSQSLMFWHLFSQINISTFFSNDLSGEPIDGEVTAIYLEGVVAAGDYTISRASGYEINALPVPSSAANAKENLTFSGSTASFNIIPQNVKSLGLYLDFKINEGTPELKNWVTYERVKINLDIPANAEPYTFNGKYNWKITIGTGSAIKFDVTVTPWESVNNIPSIDM